MQAWLVRSYRFLAVLYPSWFRSQFGSEMQAVFAQAVNEAATQGKRALLAVCWREVRDWPLTVFKLYMNGWQMEVETMDKLTSNRGEVYTNHPDSDNLDAKSSAREIWAALLPLIAWGAAWVYAAAWDIFPGLSELGKPVQWYLAAHAITLVGLGVGWWLKFPRWSFLYAGLAVTFSAYWAGLAMNGWRILGLYFLEDTRWSWRAWLPLLALVVFMLLLTRSLQPVRRFLTGIWRDWSRLSLALYGWLVFLLVTINLDSIELANEFWQPVIMVFAFLGGVILHMSVRHPWRRALGLDVGLFVGIGGAILLGRLFYPGVSQFARLSDVSEGGQALYVLFMTGWVLVWLGLVFFPALLVLFQKPKKVAPAV